MLRLRTLLVKMVALVLTASSFLYSGKEGTLVMLTCFIPTCD